jgi:hypothetical protein
MKSYRAEELFDANGTLKAELAELAPKGARRMGANPNANGGTLLRDLQMPDFRDHAVFVPARAAPFVSRFARLPRDSGVIFDIKSSDGCPIVGLDTASMFHGSLGRQRRFVRPIGARHRSIRLFDDLEKGLHDVDRHGEDDRRILFGSDFGQRLEIT